MRSFRMALAWCALALGAAGAQASSPVYVELVLDASGSMFARLPDGGTRIATAQSVLADFISRLPEDPALNVGLRIYGSQTDATDPAACTDSRLVLPLKGLARRELLDTVARTRPRGATPIAYSLTQAAADFPTTPGRKLIVLVTDGQESCRGDLKAALNSFKARGIEVDVRIIGIDLDSRAQQSFSGVGQFVNARSAAELAEALGGAVAQVAAPSVTAVPVTVTLTAGGKPAPGGASVSFVDSAGKASALSAVDGEYRASLPPGSYTARVQSAGAEALSFGGLAVTVAGPNRFSFDTAPLGSVTLTVTPLPPTAGAQVTVSYSGAPAGDKNWVTVVPRSEPDTAYLDWKYAPGASGSLSLAVPDSESEMEARYALTNPDGSTRVVGRSAPFTPRRVAASLSAPDSAVAGSAVQVSWTGPNNAGDYVTVVPKGAAPTAYLNYAYTRDGTPLTLTTPPDPGDYELRYNNEQSGRVLASRPLKLTGADYALDAPAQAVGGSQLQVRWTGPNNPRDYVTIVPKGAPVGAYTSYFYTRDGNPGTLKLPLKPGEYELRYSTEAKSPNPTLASRPLTLTGASYSLQAPREGKAGGTVEVRWTGPNNGGDYVTIVPKGAPVGTYTTYFYTRDGNPGSLKLPAQPGEYELRYSSEAESPNPTLFSLPFTVR